MLTAVSAAAAGFRQAFLIARSHSEVGRAWIGSWR